ncbi:MAG: twin-arginine translocase subunit TatC [Marinibacterium sp.]
MSQTENADEIDDSAAPLIEHLTELRQRLIWSVIAFLVAMVLVFTVGGAILDFLLVPIEKSMRNLGDPNPVMQYTAPQEYFFTLVRISMVGGLALSFPVIAYQLWRFVAPGLYRSEKSAFLPFLIASPALFLLGAAFAHYVVTPLAMQFFLGFADAASMVSTFVGTVAGGAADVPAQEADKGIDIVFNGKVNETLDITLKLIVAFGLCFQLPVLLTLMGMAGLVTAEGLASVRKYAVVAILVLAALVTPPDVITQVILFVVVFGLYEISIWLVKRVEVKREAKLRAEGYYDDEDGDDDPDGDPAGGRNEAQDDGDSWAEDDPLMAEFDEDPEDDAGDLDDDQEDEEDDPGMKA